MKKNIICVMSLIAVIFIASAVFVGIAQEKLPVMNQEFFDPHIEIFMKSDNVRGTKKGFEYEIKALEVIMNESDVEIRAKLEVIKFGVTGIVDISIQGYPYYQNRALYFMMDSEVPPEFHELALTSNLSAENRTWLDKAKDMIPSGKEEVELEVETKGGILGRLAKKVPGVEEKLEEAKEDLRVIADETVKNISKDTELLKEVAIIAMTDGLKHIPIYKLGNSIPEKAAAVAIDEVKIEGGELKITLSYLNLGWYMISLVMFAILALLFVILMFTSKGFAMAVMNCFAIFS